MKIMIVTDVFPPKCGGAGWSTYYLSKSLRKRGHDLCIVRCNSNTDTKDYDGFKIHDFTSKITKEVSFLALRKGVKKLIKEFNPDIIHAQHITSCRAVSTIKDVPTICTVRDYWPIYYSGTKFSLKDSKNISRINDINDIISDLNYSFKGMKKLFVLPISLYLFFRTKSCLKALKKMDRVFCVSNYVKSVLSKRVPQEKLLTMFNMVDSKTNAKYNAKYSDNILFVGKNLPHKGAKVLIDAMKNINPYSYNELILVGTRFEQYEELLKKNKIKHSIRGYVPNNEILKLMGESITVIPSLWHEPLGRVHLEALSVGSRIISTNTGGTPDIIEDGVNGFIFNRTESDLRKKIKTLISDSKLREKLSKNALKTAQKKFDIELMTSKYEEVYEILSNSNS